MNITDALVVYTLFTASYQRAGIGLVTNEGQKRAYGEAIKVIREHGDAIFAEFEARHGAAAEVLIKPAGAP